MNLAVHSFLCSQQVPTNMRKGTWSLKTFTKLYGTKQNRNWYSTLSKMCVKSIKKLKLRSYQNMNEFYTNMMSGIKKKKKKKFHMPKELWNTNYKTMTHINIRGKK